MIKLKEILSTVVNDVIDDDYYIYISHGKIGTDKDKWWPVVDKDKSISAVLKKNNIDFRLTKENIITFKHEHIALKAIKELKLFYENEYEFEVNTIEDMGKADVSAGFKPFKLIFNKDTPVKISYPSKGIGYKDFTFKAGETMNVDFFYDKKGNLYFGVNLPGVKTNSPSDVDGKTTEVFFVVFSKYKNRIKF